MRLDELLPAHAPGVLRAPSPVGEPIDVSALVYDSRRMQTGCLFFCVPGFERDGHEFAAVALAGGACALVVERPLGLDAPEVLVASVREAMALAAARFHGDPSAELRVVGITGTNGKTTSAFIVRSALEAAGERCGLLGTVKSVIAGREGDALRTTPEAIDLQAALRAMLDGGERACAIEVSSHALLLERTAGVRFAAGIFTNLTQDHLDFHGTMEDYFLAKRRLFVGSAAAELKVVNVGDPYGARLAAELPDVVTFGVECDADYCARDVRIEAAGSSARLSTPDGERELWIPLPGAFNVANALGALAAVHGLGHDLDTLLDALAAGVRVPGRFEPVDEGQRFAVLVDYAHTPDSLENALRAARELARGRVICVFGAGGDRDRGKRPLMGEIGARLADVAIVTSDNPRSEQPDAIVAQVLAGATDAGRAGEVAVELDRRRAIEAAIGRARHGDVVLIAGKGHEQGQEFAGGVKLPFDDVAVARECLRQLRSEPAGAAA
ncbi:MAG: UDP-N-acetylmuramoyl-L-alanyl-D-glutamate--2,6-diaminopimelate ligase [Solirubrobacteraceae bacterium]